MNTLEKHTTKKIILRNNFVQHTLYEVIRFADTILNNITLYNNAITREDVIAAAQKIGVHDFIMSLPNNYDRNNFVQHTLYEVIRVT